MPFNLFSIVADFKFDVAQAVLQTDKLQGKVNELSQAAKDAETQLAGIGIGFVKSISGAQAGILGVIGNAISASEKFKASQIEITNTLQANAFLIDGKQGSLNQYLRVADNIMTDIVKKARSFGLDPTAFVGQAKLFANFLAPKGLAGDNLENAVELARVSQKGVPALNIDQGNASQQIASAIGGQLSKNTLFGSRLFAEAGDAIEKSTNGAIKSLKEFNAAKPMERVKALIAGLNKLAGTSDVVSLRASLLNNALAGLKAVFFGIGSILKPLGDVINPVLVSTIKEVTKFLNNEGAAVIKWLSMWLKKLVKSPRQLFVDLRQLQDLAGDVGKSIAVGSLIIFYKHLEEFIAFTTKVKIPYISTAIVSLKEFFSTIYKMRILGAPLRGIDRVMKMFGNMLGDWDTKTMGVFTLIKSIGMVIIRLAGLIGILIIPFQGLSRAVTNAKINMAQYLIENEKIQDIIKRAPVLFTKILYPFQRLIEGWEKFFAVIVGGTLITDILIWAVDKLVGVFETLSDAFFGIYTMVESIVAGISAVLGGLAGGDFDVAGNFVEAFMENMLTNFAKVGMFDDALGSEKNKVVAMNVTNHNDVKIENSFKENAQPDRIAFTIKDQVEKAWLNPKQAGGGGGTGPSLIAPAF